MYFYQPQNPQISEATDKNLSSQTTSSSDKSERSTSGAWPPDGHIYHNYTYIIYSIYIYCREIYVPGTQMTLVLIEKGLVLGGWTFKNRGHWGSRYTCKENLCPALDAAWALDLLLLLLH